MGEIEKSSSFCGNVIEAKHMSVIGAILFGIGLVLMYSIRFCGMRSCFSRFVAGIILLLVGVLMALIGAYYIRKLG